MAVCIGQSIPYPKGFNWQEVCIGSGDGLVPIMHQGITWSNVDPNIWRHMLPLDHNEL